MSGSECLNPVRHLRTLFQNHELLTRMIHREISARYRQSLLGITWAFIKPLATVAVFTIIFSGIARLPSDNQPYALFAMSGLLPWTFFSVAVTSGIQSLTSQSNLVTKIYFPREILPMASMAASVLDFLISLLFLAALMIFFNVGVTWNLLYAVPILATEVLLTAGVTLFLSIANVWYRDITHAAGLMLQLWMYLSPVLYPFSIVPDAYKPLMRLNPMTGIIEAFRSAVIRGEAPDAGFFAISLVISLLVFLGGYGLFKAQEFRAADVI